MSCHCACLKDNEINVEDNCIYQIAKLHDDGKTIKFDTMNLILNNFKTIFDRNAKLIEKFIGAWGNRMKKIQEIGYKFDGKLEKGADKFKESIKNLVENVDLSSYNFFTNFEKFVNEYNSAEYKLSYFPNQLKDTIKEYAKLVKIDDIDKQYIYCGSSFDKLPKKDDLKNSQDFISFFSLFFDEIMYKMLITKLFFSFSQNKVDIYNILKRNNDFREGVKCYFKEIGSEIRCI